MLESGLVLASDSFVLGVESEGGVGKLGVEISFHSAVLIGQALGSFS